MYTLYGAPSTASLAVHWMLIELGVPFELKLLNLKAGESRTPDFLALNPSGHVPAMIVDGAPHAEVTALLMLLAERHSDAGFAPAVGAPERADYLQWMVYFANTLLPAFRAFYYPHEPAGPEHAEAAKDAARVRIEAALDRIDRRLADGRAYLLGGRLSAADFLLTMLGRWSRNLPRTAEGWPSLKRYLDRMRAMPSLRETHAREGLTDWIGG